MINTGTTDPLGLLSLKHSLTISSSSALLRLARERGIHPSARMSVDPPCRHSPVHQLRLKGPLPDQSRPLRRRRPISSRTARSAHSAAGELSTSAVKSQSPRFAEQLSSMASSLSSSSPLTLYSIDGSSKQAHLMAVIKTTHQAIGPCGVEERGRDRVNSDT